ncbi:MAG TPA: type II secretion system protein [Candidatus Angelobacter sp.]|nr:type II secretion system protein [Candidatus Angelobacter sp.]
MGRPRQNGFSAVELILVVMVILIMAAIAIPRLLQARIRANQAGAVASMRSILTAEAVYAASYPALGYSPSLANLGSNGSTCETTGSSNACLLDAILSSGVKGGYVFDIVGDGKTPDQSYQVTATPTTSNSGGCAFSSSEAGVIMGAPVGSGSTQTASKSAPIGGAGCDVP